jgi:hypothetical protein
MILPIPVSHVKVWATSSWLFHYFLGLWFT